ncbi:HBR132Cp [Eremothecium sinecaudum]|uniref:HBR132Cp n=1 Tax=Eremothecium sinecaudum TaxID=45286 RepID=A0A109UWV7_9SACH|nr:HBR132Cp [Eremothecium sinecaudum]AMD19033.1 HBR132Cp [Eremothecium sinecaudum]
MKLFENEYVFDYEWEKVTAANWKKYPNEVSTHVIATDVLRREVDATGRKLVSERLFTIQQCVPKWIMMLVGSRNVSYVREVSTVDLDSKTLTLRSCNLTYSHLLKVYETVTYRPHPEDPNRKTQFQQVAQITAYAPFSRLCNQLEDWSVQRYRENAEKGKRGFEAVLDVFSRHWDQRERSMDNIGNAIIENVSDTVEDILGSDTKPSILTRYNTVIEAAFKHS